MVEETFEAPSPEEAFALAVKKYGHFGDLQLLRARQRLGRDGKLCAEVTVAIPQEAYLAASGIDEEELLLAEIDELKEGIARMRSALRGDAGGELPRAAALLERHGIRRDWLQKALAEARKEGIESQNDLMAFFLDRLDRGLHIAPENLERPTVRLLVGPTGVGKTTTVAKLAARYSYMLDRDYKVALINLDTWRAGAYEQLGSFASLLGLEHRLARNVEEFSRHLDELAGYDVILVDTAGIAPRDTDRLIRTVEFLKSVRDRESIVSLVVSAGAKYEDIADIYDHFSFISVDDAIVTKFDETRRVGDLIAFLAHSHLRVSYLSTGQRVPDDLEPATKERILEQFVEDLDG